MLPLSAPNFVITGHAFFEMKRRGLSEDVVRKVLASPEQKVSLRPGRVAFQSRMMIGAPERAYLVRVIVDVERQPAEVVTVYRTSKIAKYWRAES